MPIYHTQNVLNGGEISPLLRGRVDQPRYSTGAREMLNFVPMPQGGVTRRPGTRFLGSALHASARLIPFVFSSRRGGCWSLEKGTCASGFRTEAW